MHITISHRKTVEQAKQLVERSIDDVFKSLVGTPIQIVEPKKRWAGDLMEFAFTARMKFLRCPVHGTVEVTSSQFVINIDVRLLGKLLPGKKINTPIETRIRGLLS
jgi:hypothetical protein